MFSAEGCRHANRGDTVQEVVRITQATIAAGTTDDNREEALVHFDLVFVQANTSILDDLGNFELTDVGEIMTVDDNDRPEGAGAETVYLLQRELPVRSGMTRLRTEPRYKLLCNERCAAHVTGGAEADRAQMLAARLQAERFVERR